jgi:hypothetical protein
MTFALIANGAVAQIAAAEFPVAAPWVWTDISTVTPAPQVGWAATETAGVWSFTAPAAPPAPTLAQQAGAAINAGFTITAIGPTLTLPATPFPTDPAIQINIGAVVNELNTAGTFFGGATTGLMKDVATPAVWHSLTAPQYKAVASAIGAYVATLDMIIDGNSLNATALPVASVSLRVHFESV